MKFHLTSSFLIVAVSAPSASAFGITPSKHLRITTRPNLSKTTTVARPLLLRAKSNDDGEDVSKGMEDAFRQLEDLNTLGGDEGPLPERKKQQDQAFAKAMQELDLKDIQDVSPAPLESEAKLYQDMASEVSGDSTEFDVISDVKSEMGGSPSVIPQFDPTMRDTDKFMEKALNEALEEAKKDSTLDIDKESILDNKEIMKEIEKIFEKANDELLEGIEDIRKEQVRMPDRNIQLAHWFSSILRWFAYCYVPILC
jgi:hypothetical protein